VKKSTANQLSMPNSNRGRITYRLPDTFAYRSWK